MTAPAKPDGLWPDGFRTVAAVLSAEEVAAARTSLARVAAENSRDRSVLSRGTTVYAIRNLARLWPGCVELLRSPALLPQLLELLGADCGVVRAMLLDKPPRAGWSLPWHRDSSIAVRPFRNGLSPDFSNPTRKAGVLHVRPPEDVLAKLVVVRIHLDEVTLANGPPWLLPEPARGDEGIPMLASAGDALLYPFLTTHRSSVSDGTSPRRVLHFELSPAELPRGRFEWASFTAL